MIRMMVLRTGRAVSSPPFAGTGRCSLSDAEACSPVRALCTVGTDAVLCIAVIQLRCLVQKALILPS